MGKVKDKLREYNRSKNFLEILCKTYFDATSPRYRKYTCWKLSDKFPNSVGIEYDYFDWKGEYHSNTQWVSISELEMFNK
jgi:exonuclease III